MFPAKGAPAGPVEAHSDEMSAAVRVRDVVSWRIERPTVAVGIKHTLVASVDVMLSAGTLMPSDALKLSPRVPEDPDVDLDLPSVFIEGVAPWMPSSWAGRQMVTMTQRAAYINPAGFEGARRSVPLGQLRGVSATTRSRSRRPKHAHAVWVLEVSDGDHQLTVKGEWLSLAWLGLLANWPEPALREAAGWGRA